MCAEIRTARSDADVNAARRLITAYAGELGVDLSFQRFDDEIADLRGAYAAILLAIEEEKVIGCVALKHHDSERCEMKRLYVPPTARGTRLGERLSIAVIEQARIRGYREMALDTMMRLKAAVRLYEKLGFSRCAPFYRNPEPDAVYMRLEL